MDQMLNTEENDLEEINVVTLNTAEGEEVEYELLDVIDYAMERYAVLIPLDEAAEDVEIFKITQEVGENCESLDSVGDDKVLDEVFRLFMEKNRERFDFV